MHVPLAMAALLLASKLEDVEALTVKHLSEKANVNSCEIVDKGERDILQALQFKLINTSSCLYREVMLRYKSA